MHLNLPSLEENEAGWRRFYGVPLLPERLLLRKSLRQLKWMAVILVAPELVVSIAYNEYMDAKAHAKQFFRGQKIAIAHGFFAQMGGFVAVMPWKSSSHQSEISTKLPDRSLLENQSLHRRVLTLSEYRKHS